MLLLPEHFGYDFHNNIPLSGESRQPRFTIILGKIQLLPVCVFPVTDYSCTLCWGSFLIHWTLLSWRSKMLFWICWNNYLLYLVYQFDFVRLPFVLASFEWIPLGHNDLFFKGFWIGFAYILVRISRSFLLKRLISRFLSVVVVVYPVWYWYLKNACVLKYIWKDWFFSPFFWHNVRITCFGFFILLLLFSRTYQWGWLIMGWSCMSHSLFLLHSH